MKAIRAIGPLLIVAAVVVFAWPQASDDHIAQVWTALCLGFVGLVWTIATLVVSMIRHRRQ